MSMEAPAVRQDEQNNAVLQKIKVSVVIPVYNADKTLRQCLDDLLHQTLREIEIICVDDGSTDCSRTILSDYADRYANFTFLRQQHGGAARARNYGMSAARGEYLSILDCDDRFEPDMLERMVARADEVNADIVICGCDGFRDGSGRSVPMTWALDCSLLPKKDPFSYKDMPEKIFCFTYGWAWDKLFRMRFVRDNRLAFQTLDATNDMYFTFSALAEAERISVLKKVLVHQRLGRKDSVSESRHRNVDCFYYALTALRDRLIDDGIFDEVKISFKNWAVALSAWQLNTLTAHPEAFIELYKKLHETILPEMDIADDSEVMYLRKNRKAAKQCSEILRTDLDEYLFRRWQSGVNSRSGLLLKRSVDTDGMTVLKPVFSNMGRLTKSFTSCARDFGAGYAIKLLFGMVLGRRK